MKFSGAQIKQFSALLRNAYTFDTLKQMLKFEQERNLEDYALPSNMQTVVFELIAAAQREGWLDALLVASVRGNPGNTELREFYNGTELAPTLRSYGQPSTVPSQVQLERIIHQSQTFLDLPKLRERLAQIEVQVCRIEINSQAVGTGFLVGPERVLTNYHVIESIFQGVDAPTGVIVRFDYKKASDGAVADPGREFHLEQDWLIDSSKYSPIDLEPDPKSGVPALDELDYALLRVAGNPGSQTLTPNNPESNQRGWMKLNTQLNTFTIQSALYIAQHPMGEPLKLALDTQAILGMNANSTRVKYRTNTDHGSSGSPCFDANWNLVALHHSGSVDPQRQIPPLEVYNEGIPIHLIAELMQKHGLNL